MKYLFKHLLGSFMIDEKTTELQPAEKKDLHKTTPLPVEKLPLVLPFFKEKRFFSDFYTKNLELTKQGIKSSVTEDQLIMQVIALISELDQIANLLSKRLREWYGLYFPELSEKITNHEHFAHLILSKSRPALQQEFHFLETMGADLAPEHVEEMHHLAKQIQQLYTLRQKQDHYLQRIMKQYCPNLLELAGATIGARLLELGRGLKHLATLPASTIQLLGAEKALFRHIKTGTKPPKYGVLFQHPLVQNAAREEKGKAARLLADKLSLCARLDYFKGEFKAKEYKKELEGKLL